MYEGYPTVSDASDTALTRPRGSGWKTMNKSKRELKGLKKRPVFFPRQITVTMDPCSKAIELLAIEYPRKLEGLKSCVLPIGQSEAGIRNSNACRTRSLGVASQGFAFSSCPDQPHQPRCQGRRHV